MRCPFCSSEETKVIDKRDSLDSSRRRRECLICKKRFTTYEKFETSSKIIQIRKRDNNIVLFDQNKITNAIFRAAKAVGGKDRNLAKKLSDEVVSIAESKFNEKDVPSVEDIQDIVEKVLIENGHAKTAKAFILYREKHKIVRETKTTLLDIEDTISGYLHKLDWRVKENSNEQYSFSGLLLYTAGKVIANYALNTVYTPAISDAHKQGYMHIHDLNHGFIGYCCGHSLKNLILWGFGGVKNKVDAKPAKHLNVIVHQMVNYIGCLQMEFAGAQAFSVHFEETIVVKDSENNIEVVKIGDFFDRFNVKSNLLNEIEVKDIENKDYFALSFSDDGKSSWKKIKKVIRHPITDPLHIVKTNKGILSVTKSHSVFSLDNHRYFGSKEMQLFNYIKNKGQLFSYDLNKVGSDLGISAPEKIVQKLKNRDLITNDTFNYNGDPSRHYAVYSTKPIQNSLRLRRTIDLNKFSKEIKTKYREADNLAALSKIELPQENKVDVLKIIDKNPELEKIVYIKLTQEQVDKLKADIKGEISLRRLSMQLGRYENYIWYILKRKVIPLTVYKRFGDFNDVKLTIFKSRDVISPILEGQSLELFVKLVGWYLTEGWQLSKRAMGICQKGEYFKDILEITKKLKIRHFVQTYESGKKVITMCGIIPALITNLCGKYSQNKKIPEFIYGLSNDLKKIFIEELLKGDGYIKGNDNAFVSTSNKLITGLNLIAISLGYRTSIKTRHIDSFGKKKIIGKRLTRYDLILHHEKSPYVLEHNDFESAIINDNYEVDLDSKYEYDLSVEDTERFIGGVGLFGLHNSSVDTLLAPFVKTDNLNYKEVKQCMQQIIYSLNIPSRWGCFSEDTEILTKNGWKLGKDLKIGEVIATFNTKNEKIEYLPVLHMTKRHYKGKMIRLKNRISDQLVTPNHRVLRRVHNYKENISNSKYVFEEAEKLKTKMPLIPISCKFDGFKINNSLAKSLAWIVAEGSLCKNERICIHQSLKNPENCDDIRNSLYDLEIPFDEQVKLSGFTGERNCVRFRINRPISKKLYETYFSDYEKIIPNSIMDISTNSARIFVDTYMKGDGHVPENKIYTKKKEDADKLQELIIKSGWGSTCYKNKNSIYVVRVIKHNYTQISSIDNEDYDGVVWCPTTINGTVVVRRKGKVFISGNSQYPFTNLTFDWVVPEDMKNENAVVGSKEQEFTYGDCQKEMDMINKAFLEIMYDGDANGRIFTFPIPTYNLTKDFNWDSENADLLFEVTAKYGTPYFQNYIGSNLDPRSIHAMCCRLNLNLKELINRPGHSFAAGDSTGSLGVVTINMNRLGYEANNKEEFFEKLRYYMNLAKDSLEIKRKIAEKNLENGLIPYTLRYLGTFRNHFSTIGLCGMNEACLNLLGKGIASNEGKEFTIETLNFMRERLIEFQKETGNLYNLEATPAESTAYRFGKLDKEKYADIITAGEKEPYLTNSTHLPVNYNDDIIEALEHQNDIQHLYTGGTIFHGFLGERVSDGRAAKQLVKKMAFNTRIPYFTLTPTFSICPDHGYVVGEHFNCPNESKKTYEVN